MKKDNYIIVLLFIVGFYFTQVLYTLGVYIVHDLFDGKIPNPELIQAGMQFLILTIICGYIYIFNKYLVRQVVEKEVKINEVRGVAKRRISHFAIGVGFGLAAGILVLTIRDFGHMVEKITFYDLQKDYIFIILSLVSTALAVIMEEFVFRGTLFPMLRKFKCSFRFSTTITGITFSLFHIGKGIGLIDLLFYFLLSVLLCYIIEKTNTIWFGVGIHLGWNIISKGISIFKVDYKSEQIFLLFEKMINLVVVVAAIVIFMVISNKRMKNEEIA